MVGEYDGSLYAYFKVYDDQLVYRDREALSVNRSDFLQITMLARDGSGITNYVIAPYGPEPIYPFEVENDYSDPVYEGELLDNGMKQQMGMRLNYKFQCRCWAKGLVLLFLM